MFVSSIWHKHFRRRLVPVTESEAKCRLLASVDVYLSLSLALPPQRLLSTWSHRRSQALIRLFPCRYFRQICSTLGPTIGGRNYRRAIRQKRLCGLVYSCFDRKFTDLIQQQYFSLFMIIVTLWFLNYIESSSLLVIEPWNVNIGRRLRQLFTEKCKFERVHK